MAKRAKWRRHTLEFKRQVVERMGNRKRFTATSTRTSAIFRRIWRSFSIPAQHPDYDAWILGGTQDNGTVRYEGSEAWYQVAMSGGGECAINDSSPYKAYHCFYKMSSQRSITGGGAGSWSSIAPSVSDNYASLFYRNASHAPRDETV